MSWLLDGKHPGWPSGQPFGDGSERYARARSTDPGVVPWDDDCYVTPLIGGYATMTEIRAAFGAVIAEAEANPGADLRVYIAGWRLNPNRDMSEHTDAWTSGSALAPERRDSTAWGLIRRMILGGVKVRILLWLPPSEPGPIDSVLGLDPHVQAHFYLARLVRRANEEARATRTPSTEDYGVVFLDTRLAASSPLLASHHQKFIVVRGTATHVAFVGGVDLAYTRRDAPSFGGDWQSGEAMPDQDAGIRGGTDWESEVATPDERYGSDLPTHVAHHATGEPVEMYGTTRQVWHDQHLKLEGPVVRTIEQVFAERWGDPASHCIALGSNDDMPLNCVISSSEYAFEERTLECRYTGDYERGRGPYYVDFGLQRGIERVRVGDEDLPPAAISVLTTGYLNRAGSHSIMLHESADRYLPRMREEPLTIVYRQRRPKPLPNPSDVPAVPLERQDPARRSRVQVWQTVPYRGTARRAVVSPTATVRLGRAGVDESLLRCAWFDADGEPDPPPPYRLGEFSSMAGLANAVRKAREFIWILDQYFWSVPYARLLQKQLMAQPRLHCVVVLPAWSDLGDGLFGRSQHRLRWKALRVLGEGTDVNGDPIHHRVAVYSPWLKEEGRNIGIYCHAKTQLFDDALLTCGSCNLNARSFGVDSEIVCAVESKSVVRRHYADLWNHFVNGSPPLEPVVPMPVSNADFDSPGWGGNFFSALETAVDWQERPVPRLARDGGHLASPSLLPNGLVRGTAADVTVPGESIFDGINNPWGLPERLFADQDLAQIVDLLESGRKRRVI